MSKKEISILTLLNEYRNCARSLWNEYFMERCQIDKTWKLVDSYNLIKEELFHSIVLMSISENASELYSLRHPSSLIKVKLGKYRKTPVQINRNANKFNNENPNHSGYWDHALTTLDSQATLLFVDFFDWDSYGFLDMSLIQCEILFYPDNPDVEGHRVLVDIRYVDIFLDKNQ